MQEIKLKSDQYIKLGGFTFYTELPESDFIDETEFIIPKIGEEGLWLILYQPIDLDNLTQEEIDEAWNWFIYDFQEMGDDSDCKDAFSTYQELKKYIEYGPKS